MMKWGWEYLEKNVYLLLINCIMKVTTFNLKNNSKYLKTK